MNITDRIGFLITANAQDAITEFKRVGLAAETEIGAAATASGKLGAAFNASGLMVKAAAGVMAFGIAKMAMDGAKDFVALTGEVRGYQRVLGGTAEDNSKIAAQMRMLGTDAEAAQKGFLQLAKRVGEGQDSLGQWGVEIAKTKGGSTDMAKTLLNVGDAYKAIEDPTKRAAFLFENFGRTGQALVPYLSKSREELKAFAQEADKNHMIFSQGQLDQGKEMGLSMRQMKEAVQGLVLALGVDLVPILKATTDGVTTIIHALDSMGDAIGLGNISIAAMGTALGLMVGGPLGAAVGLVIGLGIAFAGAKHPVDAMTDAISANVSKLEQLSADKAISEFNRLRDNLRAAMQDNRNLLEKLWDFGPQEVFGTKQVSQAQASYKEFKIIADQNVGVAQKLYNAFVDNGTATDRYKEILDGAIQKSREEKDAIDGVASANENLVATFRDVESAIIKQMGGEIGYQQSILDVGKAQDAYNEAVAKYGADSVQATEASLKLQQANLSLATAVIGLSDANQNLQDKYAGNITAVDQDLARLQSLQQQYPAAAGALQPLIDKILEYKRSIEQIPPEKKTDLYLSAQLENFDVWAPLLFRASGGPVMAGQPYVVGEEGPELFVPSGSGTIVPNGALAGGSVSSVGGGGTTINLVVDGQVLTSVVRDDLIQIGRANGSALGAFA